MTEREWFKMIEFASSFCSYLLLLLVIVVVGGVAALIGITLRKRKNAEMEEEGAAE